MQARIGAVCRVFSTTATRRCTTTTRPSLTEQPPLKYGPEYRGVIPDNAGYKKFVERQIRLSETMRNELMFARKSSSERAWQKFYILLAIGTIGCAVSTYKFFFLLIGKRQEMQYLFKKQSRRTDL